MSLDRGSLDKAIQLLKIKRLLFERLGSDPALLEGALHYLDTSDLIRLAQASAFVSIPATGGGDVVDSIKKTGETALTGDVEFDQGASIGLTQVGQKITVAYTGGAGSGEPHQAEDFLIFWDTTVWKARHGDTGVITYSDANPRVVINQALSAVGGGTYPRKVVIRGNV